MTNITMPALSPTMTSGTLAKWLVKEGDNVKSGDIIAEIETDKELKNIDSDIKSLVTNASDFALESKLPDDNELLTDIYL